MICLTVKLLTLEKVKKMCDIVSAYPIDIDVRCGSYVVDAKSFMGVMGLNLSQNLQLVLHTDDPAMSDSVVGALKEVGIL